VTKWRGQLIRPIRQHQNTEATNRVVANEAEKSRKDLRWEGAAGLLRGILLISKPGRGHAFRESSVFRELRNMWSGHFARATVSRLRHGIPRSLLWWLVVTIASTTLNK